MDKRPKRRKYNDNPYELNENNNKYIAKFKDSKNIIKIVEVDFNVYKAFDRFELDDLSQLNEYDRHIEHIELDENSIYLKGGCQLPSAEKSEWIGNDETHYIKKQEDRDLNDIIIIKFLF